jgi:oligopeptide/dipeptide ABC transporter ATP-binding protein
MGRIVELAGREELYSRPLHPYTSALLGAVPDADPSSKWESPKMGEGDRPRDAAGCAYCGRCPFAREICGAETPELKEKNGHFTACHLTESLSLPGVSKIQPRVT